MNETGQNIHIPDTAVVVSIWDGNPSDYIFSLVDSLQRYDAGVPYDIYLCANGESYELPKNLSNIFKKVFIRENTGFNLGAWDYAWRKLPNYDFYLFIQDDCFIRTKSWLKDFIKCFCSVEKCGLVGEYLNRSWDMPWSELTGADGEHKVSPKKRKRAEFYIETLRRWGIPEGKTASHLTSVVHFTARKILEEVDGYNIVRDYQNAIVAEIAFSKKIQNKGYKIVQIGKTRHSRIGHRQWISDGFFSRLGNSIKKRAGFLTKSYNSIFRKKSSLR